MVQNCAFKLALLKSSGILLLYAFFASQIVGILINRGLGKKSVDSLYGDLPPTQMHHNKHVYL
jgi:hypothetical protein